MTQNISLENSDSIFSNNIIFMLYYLYYSGQIDDLGTRAGLIHPDGGSTKHAHNSYPVSPVINRHGEHLTAK